MNFESLLRRIDTFEFSQFSGPVPLELVYEAERVIALPFSPEYRQFLHKLGSGSVESEEFIGLGGLPHLDVVKVQKDLLSQRNPILRHLTPLRGDGFGNYECMDTSAPTENGEFAIVQWLHDGGANQVCERLATSYFVWFGSVLDLIA